MLAGSDEYINKTCLDSDPSLRLEIKHRSGFGYALSLLDYFVIKNRCPNRMTSVFNTYRFKIHKYSWFEKRIV